MAPAGERRERKREREKEEERERDGALGGGSHVRLSCGREESWAGEGGISPKDRGTCNRFLPGNFFKEYE